MGQITFPLPTNSVKALKDNNQQQRITLIYYVGIIF